MSSNLPRACIFTRVFTCASIYDRACNAPVIRERFLPKWEAAELWWAKRSSQKLNSDVRHSFFIWCMISAHRCRETKKKRKLWGMFSSARKTVKVAAIGRSWTLYYKLTAVVWMRNICAAQRGKCESTCFSAPENTLIRYSLPILQLILSAIKYIYIEWSMNKWLSRSNLLLCLSNRNLIIIQLKGIKLCFYL